MVKNDYIMTSSKRIEDTINDTPNNSERQWMNVQMVKQLDNVISGKQKPQKLSTQLDFSTTIYRQNCMRRQCVFPNCRLLHMHLSQFTKNIPWYMKERSTTTSASQADDHNQQRKRLPQTVTKRSKCQKLLAKLLSP